MWGPIGAYGPNDKNASMVEEFKTFTSVWDIQW